MLTYTDYLAVDDLLALQRPKSEPAEHDEMLFIVIHQTYELWFKQVLHELNHLIALVKADQLGRGFHTLKRILKILKTLVAQVDILETMTPLEFDSFRTRLESASGFQSYQFRAVEFLLGYKRLGPLKNVAEDSPGHQLLMACLHRPSLWQEFLLYLHQQGYPVPDSELCKPAARATEPNRAVQAILISLYRERGSLAEFCEGLVDLDEGLQEWRYRHVKMVQRTIGAKGGTGGSSGAEYLKSTLFKPVFPDLWEIRSEL